MKTERPPAARTGPITLIKLTVQAWVKDHAASMGAALAFYSAFSLAPLLIIVISVAGLIMGENAAREAIVQQVRNLMGRDEAAAIEVLLQATHLAATSLVATIVGIVTLLLGATTVLVELQADLDRIWQAPPRRNSGWVGMLLSRLISLAAIMGIGFFLLLSFAAGSVLAAISSYWSEQFSGTLVLFLAAEAVVSLAMVTVMFAMLYKWLPNVKITWRDVWIGAFGAAVLFTLGRFAIGFYLAKGAIGTAYGAAGTLVVLLFWLYYSAQIFLLGAEFTWVYANRNQKTENARGGQSSDSGSPQ